MVQDCLYLMLDYGLIPLMIMEPLIALSMSMEHVSHQILIDMVKIQAQ